MNRNKIKQRLLARENVTDPSCVSAPPSDPIGAHYVENSLPSRESLGLSLFIQLFTQFVIAIGGYVVCFTLCRLNPDYSS